MGTVDYDEFIALVYDDNDTLLEVLRSKVVVRYGEGKKDPLAVAQTIASNLQEVFTVLDAVDQCPSDGEISTEDFGRTFASLDIEMSPYLLNQLVKLFDVNNSGSID